MPPQQQNYPQTPQPGPQPGMPNQGPGIFAPPPPGSEKPKKHSKIPLILAILFFISTIILAILAFNFYNQMVSYRDDYQARAAVDINKALETQKAELEAEFAEQEKSPTKTYQTQSSAASVKIVYPKTWDLYAEEDNVQGVVNSWFNENYVPDTGNRDNAYSLRLEVLDNDYTSVARRFESAASRNEVTITPYKAPNVDGAETGIKLNGEVVRDRTGSMVILPVRDKTLQIWTESDRYIKDFNDIVLKNLTYSP